MSEDDRLKYLEELMQPHIPLRVLQEIRTEIEKPLREERYFDTADAKAQAIALNWCLEIIDKHIKEIEE